MSRWYVGLLLFGLFQSYGQSVERYSTVVRIAAWTTTDERIEKIRVVLSSRDGKEKYIGTGHDVEMLVPTGEYVVQVGALGFESKRQIMLAYQPAVFRSVVLPIARLHGQTAPSLAGTVQNYDGNVRNLRVRLVGLYGNELWEAIPDKRGAFKFPTEEGSYLLLVVANLDNGLAIVDSEPVRIPREKQVTINVDLKGKHGTVLPPEPGIR